MDTERIEELEQRIAEVRQRIPPHSVPPAMLEELEELEEQLKMAREEGI
ncbi:MAG: histidine kinase [Chloroflexota bacterium]|nr:histidine kinase [Chloroflexota bacterium]